MKSEEIVRALRCVSRLRELAEADRAGRLVVLPKGPEVE